MPSKKQSSKNKNKKMQNNNAMNQTASTYKQKLENMKYEIASEMGVDLKQGPNLTAREAGYVGGYMVKKMIEDVEQKNANAANTQQSSNKQQ